jgi:hypothetical protein
MIGIVLVPVVFILRAIKRAQWVVTLLVDSASTVLRRWNAVLMDNVGLCICITVERRFEYMLVHMLWPG